MIPSISFLLLAAAPVQVAALPQAGPAAPRVEELHLDPAPEHVAAVDLDGDGDRELVAVRDRVLALERAEPLVAEIPGRATLWTVGDHDSDGRPDFLALLDGETLVRLELRRTEKGEELAWSPPLLGGLGGRSLLPLGVRPADFVRDLDGDGACDLALPLGRRLQLWFGSAAGLRPGPVLDVAAALSLEAGGLPGRGLLGRVSRRLSVPALRMRDLNGDSVADLSVAEGSRVRQYVRGPEGLPAEPTVMVDLSRFRERVGELRFDPTNIAGLARYVVFPHWTDLNSDGAQDLIVLFGGNVVVFLGGPRGLDLRRPVEQLQAAGNVLYAFAAPVDRDAVPDLVLLRVEDIGLARLIKWLVASFSVEVEILAYRGLGGGRFDNRPMPPPASRKLKIDSPSILKLYQQREEGDALRRTIVRLADFDGDGRATDLVILDDHGELTAYRDVVRDPALLESVAERFLSDLLRRERELDLDARTLTGWLLGRTTLLVSLAQGREPFFRLPPPPDWEPPQAMTAQDFDGDGRDEVLMLRRTAEELPPPQAGGEPRRRHRLHGFLVDPDGG